MAARSALTRSLAGLRRHQALSAALLFLVVAWLLAAAVAYGWHPLIRTDHLVLHRLHRYALGHSSQASAWRAITSIGQPWCWRGAALVAVVVLALRRHGRAAVYLAIVAALTGLVSTAVKVLVDRSRPSWDYALIHLGGPSFPSGHALTAMTIAGGFVAVLYAIRTRRAVVVTAGVVLGAAAVLVSTSRLVLGVHYLSDVIGGWLMAATIVCAFLPVLGPHSHV